MIRVCPHSDTACPHGMGCAFSCATDAYDGTKRPTPAAPASPAGENGRGPGIHNENKAEDLQRLRAALEHIAEACDAEISAVKLLEGCRQIASQALSSVVGEVDQGLSSSTADLGGDGERAATPAQSLSEKGAR